MFPRIQLKNKRGREYSLSGWKRSSVYFVANLPKLLAGALPMCPLHYLLLTHLLVLQIRVWSEVKDCRNPDDIAIKTLIANLYGSICIY